MDTALVLALAGAVCVLVLFAIILVALGVWALEGLQSAVSGFPLVGGRLAAALGGIEAGFLSLARVVISAGSDLLTHAALLAYQAFATLHAFLASALTSVVNTLQGSVSALLGVVSLAVMPPVEKSLPAWVKELEKAADQLAKEPAFRAGGPLAILRTLIQAIMRVLPALGPFVRLVALPLTGIVLALWALIELLGAWTRLNGTVTGLVGFVNNLDYFRKRDEAAFDMLVITVNGLIAQQRLLQVDLEKERAARVLALQQEQQARHAAESLQEARRLADRSQWSPLLILTALAVLGADGVGVLRKTAQCDPCKTIDDQLSDLPWRVRALEAYGEP